MTPDLKNTSIDFRIQGFTAVYRRRLLYMTITKLSELGNWNLKCN